MENHSSIIRWMLCGLLGGRRGWPAVGAVGAAGAEGAGGEPDSNLGFTDTTTDDERQKPAADKLGESIEARQCRQKSRIHSVFVISQSTR